MHAHTLGDGNAFSAELSFARTMGLMAERAKGANEHVGRTRKWIITILHRILSLRRDWLFKAGEELPVLFPVKQTYRDKTPTEKAFEVLLCGND